MDKEQKIHAGMPVHILVAAMGLILSGIGVGIFLYSSLGVDPASVFELGVAKQLHISYGTASALLNVLILAIVFFVDKKHLNISSLLAIFLIGYTADIMKLVLSAFIPAQLPLMMRIVFILIGCAIKLEVIAAGNVVRQFELPHAFVMDYTEELDDDEGVGTWYLHIKQKKDQTRQVKLEGGFAGGE